MSNDYRTPEEKALGITLRAALRRVIIADLTAGKGLSQEEAEARVMTVSCWEEDTGTGPYYSCGPDISVTVTYQDSREDLGYASFHTWKYHGDMAELMRRLAGE